MAVVDPAVWPYPVGQDDPTAAAESAELWIGSEGQVANAGAYALCALTVWLLLPLLFAAWRACGTARHRYTLTSQRLSEQSGVFVRRTDHLELYRVKDIAVSEPLIQALFGRGQITLITSDRTTPVVVLNAVASPLAVAALIRTCVERCRTAKGVREIDS